MVYKSDTLISKALSYVGYLEKASEKDLDNFTANAGNANYTRFCRDYEKYTGQTGLQPSYWCAEFVSCVVVEAFGLEAAKKLLCGNLFASCTAGRDQFRKKAQFHTDHPRAGDIVMYWNSKRNAIGHCGIVTKVSSSSIFTVEGNTSSGNDVVIDNGGAVAEKKYSIDNSRIAGYCRMALDGIDPTESIVGDENIASFQQWLNENYGLGLVIDGVYGKLTKQASVKALQRHLNAAYQAQLTVDGIFGIKTQKAVRNVYRGSRGHLVYILQGMLYCLGYDPNGFDGICGSGCVYAIKAFQTKNFSTDEVDGICGPNTWARLFK